MHERARNTPILMDFAAADPVLCATQFQARQFPAHVMIAGENRVFYGGDTLRKTDWRAKALAQVSIDPGRVHFVGTLAQDADLAMLQRSDAHVHLTVPFVPSWSMQEAMSVGCPLVPSNTEPVREFATAAEALLVPMDPGAIRDAILQVPFNPDAAAGRGMAARWAIAGPADRAILFPRKQAMAASPAQRQTPPKCAPARRSCLAVGSGRDAAILTPFVTVQALRRRDFANVSKATARTMMTPMMIC